MLTPHSHCAPTRRDALSQALFASAERSEVGLLAHQCLNPVGILGNGGAKPFVRVRAQPTAHLVDLHRAEVGRGRQRTGADHAKAVSEGQWAVGSARVDSC